MSHITKYSYTDEKMLNMIPIFKSILPQSEQSGKYKIKLLLVNLLMAFYYFLYDYNIFISESTYVLIDGEGRSIPQVALMNEEERIKEMEDVLWDIDRLTTDSDTLEEQIRHILQIAPYKLDFLKKNIE